MRAPAVYLVDDIGWQGNNGYFFCRHQNKTNK